MHSGTPLDIKKVYSSSSYFTAYNNLLVLVLVLDLVYSSNSKDVCVQAEGMMKPVNTF